MMQGLVSYCEPAFIELQGNAEIFTSQVNWWNFRRLSLDMIPAVGGVLHGFSNRERGQHKEQVPHRESSNRAWFNTDEWNVLVLSKGTARGEAATAMTDWLPNSSQSSWAKQLARPPNALSQSTRRWNPWKWSHSSTKKWSLSSKSSRNWWQWFKKLSKTSDITIQPLSWGKHYLFLLPDLQSGGINTKSVNITV